MTLTDLGWDSKFHEQFEPFREQGLTAMRIIRENRGKYLATGGDVDYECEISGKFRFNAKSKADFPAVGDWIAASVLPEGNKAVIQAVLKRKSSFSRKVAGQVTDEQVVAANVDTVFLVTGLDENYNLRRIERYLVMAWNSGAMPVVLLNKADLRPDEAESLKLETEAVTAGVEVILLSAASHSGLEQLQKFFQKGKTVAFLGSSGAGKSTIINALLGTEILKTNEVSGLGSRGRHTTTFRELFVLPDGGIVIDTPGMRELQVWGDEEGLSQVFNEIEELAQGCRYRDCAHVNEPECAVLEAVRNGSLDAGRLESFYKLRKEFSYLEDRQTTNASVMEKNKNKHISKAIKRYFKEE